MTATRADDIAISGLLFCSFQIIVGVIGFFTYRGLVGKEHGGASRPPIATPIATPIEPWSPVITTLALLNYLIVCTSSAIVLALSAPTMHRAFVILMWVAFIVYFSMIGMMSAVVFPRKLLGALAHVASPFLYAFLFFLLGHEALGSSIESELLFVGVYFATIIPLMLSFLFVRVGFAAVKGNPGMLAVNLLIIVPLALTPIMVWTKVVPDLIGPAVDEPLWWLLAAGTTSLMLVQYVGQWLKHVKPAVDAGRV